MLTVKMGTWSWLLEPRKFCSSQLENVPRSLSILASSLSRFASVTNLR